MIRLNHRQRLLIKLIALNLLLLLIAVWWLWQSTQMTGVQLAVAKGKSMLDMNLASAPQIDVELVQAIANQDAGFGDLLADYDVEFVNAVLLRAGEANSWEDAGCLGNNCAHITYYNYDEGGTLEAIINLDDKVVVATHQDLNARPGGSTFILPKVMAIAAADTQVQAVLGDIGVADPAMVPMSAWLADDACRDEWCVDLTFFDPEGSGRIFHVFVNMDRQEVARTFYSRGRAERSAAKPVAQRNSYTDGCHEQYGWELCWEMTAHDGVDFRDATYNGRLIYSSAKIGQVEAWYPSWPGGYRDEIGFTASVPPFGDTQITDLGDGFEVRQMFTEFTRWPNCICCYRYEEVVRFYEDGRFEFLFVSHGPGCDDPSIYRPFWRIDLDLDGPENDDFWLWESIEWIEAETEFEAHPLFDDLSPDGYVLATLNGDVSYRWQLPPTDPLGLDEAYLFGVQFKEGEGDGPILTGPGDTFIPPRQWVDGEALSGENGVLWYVPILKTKLGNPWWCQPDPEPDFTPCDAALKAIPAGALTQPPTPMPTAVPPTIEPNSGVQSSTPTAMPTETAVPFPSPTPRPIDGLNAEEIMLNAGCGSCHKIGEIGEDHKVGPDLSQIGLIAQNRIPNKTAEEYLLESILQPNAFIAPNCPNSDCLPNIMPRDYESRLSEAQITTVVNYLLTLTEEIPATAVPAKIGENASPASKAVSAAKTAVSVQNGGPISPLLAVQIFLLTLVFLLSLLLFWRTSADE